MEKEEYAIVLDFLPNGYPLEKKMIPIVQAVGERNLILLELVLRRDASVEIGEKLYIGEGKRDKVYYILGRLLPDKVTESAKAQLEEFIKKVVKERESEFVDFFNKSEAINKRVHQLEFLPGLGKKHMKDVLKARQEKPFESFEDIRVRVPNLPDPERAVEKRIFKEMVERERYNLFVK